MREFPAVDVRRRFAAAHVARRWHGKAAVRDGSPMRVGPDPDGRGLPGSIGSGLARVRGPVAAYSLATLGGAPEADTGPDGPEVPGVGACSDARGEPREPAGSAGPTIARAERRLAAASGVEPGKIEIVIWG